jgi:hypothetical protein
MVLIQEYPDISGHIRTYPDISRLDIRTFTGYPDIQPLDIRTPGQIQTNPDKSRRVSAALPGRSVHGFTEPGRTSK